MAASGEEWIYVLSQHDDAEVEQAVTADVSADAVTVAATATATAAGEEETNNACASKNNPADDDGKPDAAVTEDDEEESNGDGDDDGKATSAQPPSESSDTKAPPQPSPKDGGGEHTWDDQEYPEYYTEEEIEVEKAYRAYIAALERAFKFADDDDSGAATGGRGRAMDNNPYHYDRYDDDDLYGAAEPYPSPYYRRYGGSGTASAGLGAEPYPYPYGGSATAPLGPIGSGSGYEYYNRYGFGSPGAAYGGSATGYGNYYYVEPYAYTYVPGYWTAYYQAPPPPAAFTAGAYLPPPQYVYRPGPGASPAPVSSVELPVSVPRYSRSARADEQSPAAPAVAPTTQPPEPLWNCQ